MRLSVLLVGIVVAAAGVRAAILRDARPGAAAEIVATTPDVGEALTRLAELDDDTGKAKQLEGLAPFVFGTIDSELTSNYFKAVKSIESREVLRALLVGISPYASDPTVARQIRSAASKLPPESRAQVLGTI